MANNKTVKENIDDGTKALETAVETETTPDNATVPETAAKPKTTMGVVANCARLNIRTEGKKKADVAFVVTKGTKLKINLTESTAKWLKVSTKDNKSGYCMAEYVSYNR